MALPTTTGLFRQEHYARLTDYKALGSWDSSTLYLIKDAKQVYLGAELYAGVSVEFVAALPGTMFEGVLYVVTPTPGDISKIYRYDGTVAVEIKVGTDGAITADSEEELENKTIDAEKNTILNLTLDNMADGVVLDDISGTVDDDTVPTTKAVVDLVNHRSTSIFKFMGGVDLAAIGSTFDNAKIGYAFSVQNATNFTYLGEEYNTTDLIVFQRDIVGSTVVAADVMKIDNTESSDIIRKLTSGFNADELLSATADGGVKSTGKTVATTIDEDSDDDEIATAKATYDLIAEMLTIKHYL